MKRLMEIKKKNKSLVLKCILLLNHKLLSVQMNMLYQGKEMTEQKLELESAEGGPAAPGDGDGSHAFFHPVNCEVCGTELGVLDEDEVCPCDACYKAISTVAPPQSFVVCLPSKQNLPQPIPQPPAKKRKRKPYAAPRGVRKRVEENGSLD